MPIPLAEHIHTDRFVSIHFIGSPLPNGRVMLTRSGIVIVRFDGTSSDDWRGDELRVTLDLRAAIERARPRAPRKGFIWALRFEQWAPIAGLNAIFNAGNSINSGFSVDTFGIRFDDQPDRFITLHADLAVRDSDARLIRVGYYVTIVAILEEIPEPIID